MSGEHGEPQRRAQDALATYFVGESTMSEALTKLCAAALDAVAPAELAGISMTVDARIGTYVFTHPEVIEIDRSQYEDRKSVVQGKSVDLGGRRIIKKNKATPQLAFLSTYL